MPTRHFVTVGERQVHYRRTGSGPAVVVLHESPLSSRAYIPLAEVLAADFTVLLLDNPGFGSSDPLPQESPEIEDFTDALVATLDALGIEQAAFYGAHTGACIALDLAHRYPQRVAVSVLDGLPYFTDEQRELMLREYTPAIEPRWDGTHLLAAFNQRRDMKLFFPWFSKTPEARQAITMPPDVQLHAEALDLVKAKDHYAKGYKAAFRYRVRKPLAAVTVPVAITARGDEILGAPQADGASATVRTELLPTPRDEWAAALHRIFRESPHAPAPPATPLTGFVPGKLVRLYMEAPHGQLLVRSQHDVPGRPLVMLQPSPFSGAILAPLAAELARTRPVLLLDTPGYGDSDRLPEVEEPSIADFADGILGALDCLEEFDLYGTLTGSAIAAEIALRAPGRVRSLVLETPPLFDKELRRELYEQMTPVMPEPSGDGGLFVWAWGFARDHAMWFPHYRKSPEFARPGPPITPDQIHLRAVELLKTGSTYRTGPRAAFSYDFEGRLPQLAVRTLVSSHAAATAYRHLRDAAALVPGSVLREHDGPVASQAAVVTAFLDEAR